VCFLEFTVDALLNGTEKHRTLWSTDGRNQGGGGRKKGSLEGQRPFTAIN